MGALLEIDIACGGPWDRLGEAIKDSGQEDSSGFRRYLSVQLANQKYERVMEMLNVSFEEAKALRQAFVDAFGEPE